MPRVLLRSAESGGAVAVADVAAAAAAVVASAAAATAVASGTAAVAVAAADAVARVAVVVDKFARCCLRSTPRSTSGNQGTVDIRGAGVMISSCYLAGRCRSAGSRERSAAPMVVVRLREVPIRLGCF